jgi:hypothetical protein
MEVQGQGIGAVGGISDAIAKLAKEKREKP